ncbi:LysR family transcriptional regulator [Rhodococcus opacus]|uniref:LysR family transcriptional regulator n=1 Tax=Rhodococcus opacus TaxID=37919 RepID=UPI00155AA8B6|nr:LysR family transcriptional regulator [Rhodococcus opacus]
MHPQAPSFTLRQLAYLVAVADTGTVIRAAERMHVSPSAMSDAITELERVLGARLCIRRKSHGVTMTSAGSRAVTDARDLLRRAAELGIAVDARGDRLAGPLTVGCFGTIAPTVMPPILNDFGAAHPGLDITFVESTQDQLVAQLESGRTDVAFAYDAYLPANVPRTPVFALRPHVVLAADHPLAREEEVRLEDLVDEDFIMLDAPPSTEHALGFFTARGLTPRVRHRTGNPDVVRTLVGRGFGYGMLIQQQPDHTNCSPYPVVRKAISPVVDPIEVVIIWSSTLRPSARARALVEFTRSVAWLPPSPPPGEA